MPRYTASHVDEKLAQWFLNDTSHGLLHEIWLQQGSFRSLRPFRIAFDYPIAIVAGKNGSGKSTILALAACAFHATDKSFKLSHRKLPYYRFSDFFVQSEGELAPDGAKVRYKISHNNWKVSKTNSLKVGPAWQARTKTRGGRWNDYSLRVNRCVIFLGIERVVPHNEKSVARSYKSFFKSGEKKGWEGNVQQSVARVLTIPYEDLEFRSYTKYRLPFVRCSDKSYSGFNMGAGENALFEIFALLWACPEGALICLDEIELGLHEQAQLALMLELKELCLKRKLQIVATTHSTKVLSAIPPSARYFVESRGSQTILTQGVSTKLATGRLSGTNSKEVVVYCEDGLSFSILQAVLPLSLRVRAEILSVGSHGAVITQLAAHYKSRKDVEALAILDGDMRDVHGDNLAFFTKRLETPPMSESEAWAKARVAYLPGGVWPERWMVAGSLAADREELADLALSLGCDTAQLQELLSGALTQKKHAEIAYLAEKLALPRGIVEQGLSRLAISGDQVALAGLVSAIQALADSH